MSEALWGVLIGGAVAVLPPMVTLIFQTINENKKEKKKNRIMAYDKIIRYLYKMYNINLKTTKMEDIYTLTEEVSVLASLYCDSLIRKKIKEVSNLFAEYIQYRAKDAPKKTKEIREQMRLKNIEVREMISKEMGNK